MSADTPTRTEYRVVWKRAGGTAQYEDETTYPFRKVRRFQSLAAAERHIVRLTGPDVDPHYKCDHESGHCIPLPPIIDGPWIEVRSVTPWQREAPAVEAT